MEQLENIYIAFLDTNNIVINVSVFAETDESLVNSIKEHFGAATFVNCSDLGQQGDLGDEFFNNKFYSPRPSEDYLRDEVNGIWILPRPSEDHILDVANKIWILPRPSKDHILDVETGVWILPRPSEDHILDVETGVWIKPTLDAPDSKTTE